MIARVFEGKAGAARNRHDLSMQGAWTNAALVRAKKMPSLASLMPESKPEPKKTRWQDMYASAAFWAASVGEIRTEGSAA